jgi:trans-aconitate methyltransferase
VRRFTGSLLLVLASAACSRGAAAPAAPATHDDAQARRQYEAYRQPSRIVAALALAPGLRVADVGAGRGFLTGRFADAVGPDGRVVATDVDGGALAAIAPRANVVTRVVRRDDPGLERAAYDRIFLGEVDQYLPDRAAYFRALVPALAPGGFIAVSNRLTYRAAVLAAANAAGLRAVELPAGLPASFFIRLEQP